MGSADVPVSNSAKNPTKSNSSGRKNKFEGVVIATSGHIPDYKHSKAEPKYQRWTQAPRKVWADKVFTLRWDPGHGGGVWRQIREDEDQWMYSFDHDCPVLSEYSYTGEESVMEKRFKWKFSIWLKNHHSLTVLAAQTNPNCSVVTMDWLLQSVGRMKPLDAKGFLVKSLGSKRPVQSTGNSKVTITNVRKRKHGLNVNEASGRQAKFAKDRLRANREELRGLIDDASHPSKGTCHTLNQRWDWSSYEMICQISHQAV